MKRANGQGSVEVLPDRRARIRATINGKRQQIGPIYPDEETALRMLAALNAEREAGTIVAGTDITLSSYGAEWLDRREVGGSRRREVVRSIAGERSVWARHVAPSAIASLPLTAIRPRDVEAFSRELRGRKALHAITRGRGADKRVEVVETTRPLSRAMQREALRLVRSVLDAAVRDELIERNPAEGVEVARGTAAPRDLSEDWLRWPEIVQLLGCEDIDARDRRAYACAIGLALRMNDLKAIERDHVELDREVPGPCVRVWCAKPQRWHRVPVMPWLVPVVRAQLDASKKSRWLFPRADGDAYAKGFDFGWAEDRERNGEHIEREPSALERAGIARRIRFHDLRGTCATHLALGTWGRRWSLHEIQAMLAHSDQRVTERYVRRAVDTLAEAAAATPGRPGLPTASLSVGAVSARNQRAPGAGLEPATNRLTAPGSTESSRDDESTRGQRMGNLAREVVKLAADGDSHALRRALELADAVLAYLASERADETSGTG